MVGPIKALLAALVIFTAGVAMGVVMTGVFSPNSPRGVQPSASTPATPEKRREYLERLDREVQLTPEQRAKAEQILTASQARVKTLWESIAPEARDEYRRARRQILDLLTADQKSLLEQRRKERAKSRREPSKPKETSEPNPVR